MSKLSDKLTNDPLGRGYSGMSDTEAAWFAVRRFGKSAWNKQRQYIDAYKGIH